MKFVGAKKTFGPIFLATFRYHHSKVSSLWRENQYNRRPRNLKKSHFEIFPFAIPPTKGAEKIVHTDAQKQPIRCLNALKLLKLYIY